ncbi:beta-lactamase/transpeptidase-like protein [Umbelopsis sp. PMI_123]|nr:beta-lactamase/transpeptidase-like protein [Umbelopsis sp. PMI_123]
MGRKKHLAPEKASRAITLINDAKWKPGKVAEHLGVSRTAIRNLVKRSNNHTSVAKHKPIGTICGIDKAHHQRILEIVEQQQYKNQSELKDILNEELGLNASRTTYYRLIRELTSMNNTKSKSTKQGQLLNNDPSQRENLSKAQAFLDLDIDRAEIYLTRGRDVNETVGAEDLEYWNAIFTSLQMKGSNKMTDSEVVQTFRTYAEDRCRKFHVHGIAYALVRDGKIIFEGGFGHANDAMTKVSETTQWSIGEFTHSFIAVLAAQLVENGQLGWNEPISTYIPKFSLSDEIGAKHTTIIDFLANRTGIPYNELAIADIFPHGQSVTQDWIQKQIPALVMERLKHISSVASFRSSTVPNELMYIAVIRALEDVAFKSWKDQLQDNILKPLGLKNTGVYSKTRHRDKKFYATGYMYDRFGSQSRDIPIHMVEPLYNQYTAAKAMYSTVHDMAEWIKSLMHHSQINPERVQPVSRETLSNYIFAGHSVASTSGQPYFSTALQGLGWIISTYGGEQVCSHFSEFTGITTSCVMAPSRGCGFILFTNQQNSPLCRFLPWCAMDLLLDKRPEDWRTALKKWEGERVESQVAETRSRSTLACAKSHNLGNENNFIGSYNHKSFGVARIEPQMPRYGTSTSLRMTLGLLDGKLQPNQLVGYVWELNEAAEKVIGCKLPYVYGVRLFQDYDEKNAGSQYLSLSRLKLDTLEPIEKPIYFERK